jgi:hypothetical protein
MEDLESIHTTIRIYRSDLAALEALKWRLAGKAESKRTVADTVRYLLTLEADVSDGNGHAEAEPESA